MTDEITGTEAVVEQAEESTIALPESHPLEADIELSIENIDLETGLVTLSAQVDGEGTHTMEWFLPDLLDWSDPDESIWSTTVEHDIAGDAAEPIKKAVAEQEDVDPGQILVQSLSAPNIVEYCLKHDDGGIVTTYDHTELDG